MGSFEEVQQELAPESDIILSLIDYFSLQLELTFSGYVYQMIDERNN